VKRKRNEDLLPLIAPVRAKGGIIHGCERVEGKPGMTVGIAMKTLCGQSFVTGHWKGHKNFKDNDSVVSMRVVPDGKITCVVCIAEEPAHGTRPGQEADQMW